MRDRAGLLLALCMAGILGNSTPICQPVIVGGMIDGFSVAVSTAGFISTAEMAAFAAAALVCAALVRTVVIQRLVLAASFLAILGNLLAGIGGAIEIVIAGRIVAGLGAGIAIAAGAALAAQTKKPDVTYAIVLASVLAFAGVFLTVLPPIVATSGISVVFFVLAVLGGLTGVCGLAMSGVSTPAGGVLGPENPEPENPKPESGNSLKAIPVLAACFLLYAGHGAFWTYQERMGVAIGLSASEIGMALGLASAAGFFGAFAAASLGTRIGRTIPQVLALAMSIFAALFLVYGTTVETYVIAAILIALFWFFGVPYLTGLAAAMDKTGRLAATSVATLNIGQATGPFLAAMIVETGGYSSVGWLAAGCYALCLIMVVPSARRLDCRLAQG